MAQDKVSVEDQNKDTPKGLRYMRMDLSLNSNEK